MFNQHYGIQIGDSTIPADKMTEHMMISGSPGSGKSVLIRQLLRQIRDRGRKAIVFDVAAQDAVPDRRRHNHHLRPKHERHPPLRRAGHG
jgi:Ni2+-binding GTPase involved in maturation of urease and hydrogenase